MNINRATVSLTVEYRIVCKMDECESFVEKAFLVRAGGELPSMELPWGWHSVDGAAVCHKHEVKIEPVEPIEPVAWTEPVPVAPHSLCQNPECGHKLADHAPTGCMDCICSEFYAYWPT